MLVQFDLNQNDRDALLRHCQMFRPASGDGREDARLVDALQALEQSCSGQLIPDTVIEATPPFFPDPPACGTRCMRIPRS
ncbi:hypothetical protein, partial [Pseudomonas syringae group genomosp. 3]|uniref:hypothetical protein n=1 Tax=Pseudomonas syringae group genomosp. 3 TaxID=251701 RepID=UPI0011C36724